MGRDAIKRALLNEDPPRFRGRTFIFKRWVEVNELASVVWRLRELESGLREGARASAAACNGCAGADGLEHSGTEVRRMPMRGRRCWGEGAGGARWTPLKQLPV